MDLGYLVVPVVLIRGVMRRDGSSTYLRPTGEWVLGGKLPRYYLERGDGSQAEPSEGRKWRRATIGNNVQSGDAALSLSTSLSPWSVDVDE